MLACLHACMLACMLACLGVNEHHLASWRSRYIRSTSSMASTHRYKEKQNIRGTIRDKMTCYLAMTSVELQMRQLYIYIYALKFCWEEGVRTCSLDRAPNRQKVILGVLGKESWLPPSRRTPSRTPDLRGPEWRPDTLGAGEARGGPEVLTSRKTKFLSGRGGISFTKQVTYSCCLYAWDALGVCSYVTYNIRILLVFRPGIKKSRN
jgi:hypothetical protein